MRVNRRNFIVGSVAAALVGASVPLVSASVKGEACINILNKHVRHKRWDIISRSLQIICKEAGLTANQQSKIAKLDIEKQMRIICTRNLDIKNNVKDHMFSIRNSELGYIFEYYMITTKNNHLYKYSVAFCKLGD